MKKIVVAGMLALAASCGGGSKEVEAPKVEKAPAPAVSIVGVDDLAERFVKLALALGEHDPAYVDAYSGPPEWAEAAKAAKSPLDDLGREAKEILEALDVLSRDGVDPREAGLKSLATAALARARMAKGERISFNEEARLLYGVSPPDSSLADFDAALAEIDALLPGAGALAERYNAFRGKVEIPADKLKAVFDAAIAECRRRTVAHYQLPDNERFTLRFVTDKPWSGYNWYQGDFESVIEINVSQPIHIDRAVDLGCHEGYPGHHVWNLFVDSELRRKKGWIEYSILPLFSPQALIGEGSANFGVGLAFTETEKLAFERDTLFPLAGIDPAYAEKLQALNLLKRKLSYADNYVAREYLEGRLDRSGAAALIEKYKLETPEIAARRIDFFDSYRSYVINYNIGRDLVAAYVEAERDKGVDPWVAFESVLKSPDALGDLMAR
jgi:hypothetical protein